MTFLKKGEKSKPFQRIAQTLPRSMRSVAHGEGRHIAQVDDMVDDFWQATEGVTGAQARLPGGDYAH